MKPRPFSNTDTDEVRSKVIFESKIDHRYVKSLVKIRSTVPNDDGHIIVCEEEGQPTGIIFVQLKKIPKGARTYQCEAELFVIERVTIAPFILLCVDVDNEKVFWKHLLPDQIEPGKKSQVIKFTDQDEIDSKKEYIKKWIELVKEYSIRASSVSKGLPIAKTNESATGIEVDASLVASEKKELENYKFKSKIDEAKILTDNNQ